jgi:hypothetical protein
VSLAEEPVKPGKFRTQAHKQGEGCVLLQPSIEGKVWSRSARSARPP